MPDISEYGPLASSADVEEAPKEKPAGDAQRQLNLKRSLNGRTAQSTTAEDDIAMQRERDAHVATAQAHSAAAAPVVHGLAAHTKVKGY